MPRTDSTVPPAEGQKRCNDCGVAQDIDTFLSTTGKVYAYCRSCRILRQRTKPLRSTAEARARKRERDARWYRANREKRRAHTRVAKALRSGKLVRPDACERCATVAPVHAHHADYSLPLDVEWLCVPCHGRLHAIERQG